MDRLTPPGEVEQLQRSVNDLTSLMALPAMWAGGDRSYVMDTLLDVLLDILHLDFAYVLLRESNGGATDMVRLSQALAATLQPEEVGRALTGSLGSDVSHWPSAGGANIGAGAFSIATVPVGLQAAIGVIVAGSRRPGFAGESDRLLLSVAANQAALALQEARLLDDQRRLAADLDRRVAQRTAELAQANEALRREVAERRRAEDALRASERESRDIVDSIPGGIVTFAPDGELERANRQLLDYFGKALVEVKGWETNEVVHPDDLQNLSKTFREVIASGRPGSFTTRLRRSDGVFRWFEVRNLPLRDSDGHIVRWYGLLTDIDDRKRAEDALAARERDLRMALDTIPAGIIVVSPDSGIIDANKRLLEYLGYSLEALKQWTTTDMVHPDDFEGTLNYFREFMALGRESRFETRIRRFDGVYRWFQVRNDPLRDADGHIIRWYGLLTDIDDRRRAEDELRRSEASLAEGERLSAVGSFSWWLDTDEVRFSDQLYRIFEFEQGSPVALAQIIAAVHPDDRPQLITKQALARRGFADLDYDIRLLMPDGRIKYLRTVARMIDHPGAGVECLGTIQDITERRLAEESLAQLRTELAHVSRVSTLGAMTASIAHEVNQPLAGIVTNASTSLRMLASDPPNISGAQETARRTLRDAKRATDVISRLRALLAKRETSIEPVDLNEASREVIALSQRGLQDGGAALQLELADNIPPVEGDRIQLQQVILNLVLNAVEAMVEINDRPRRLIIRTARAHQEGVVLAVQDAGPGIDPANVERIFEPFHTTKANGLGIGLSICRTIVEAYGGKLWATPAVPHGAIFQFTLRAWGDGAGVS